MWLTWILKDGSEVGIREGGELDVRSHGSKTGEEGEGLELRSSLSEGLQEVVVLALEGGRGGLERVDVLRLGPLEVRRGLVGHERGVLDVLRGCIHV